MELQKNSSLSVMGVGTNSVEKGTQPKLNKSTDMPQNDPFKEQLNKQVEQIKSSKKSEKNENNQSDEPANMANSSIDEAETALAEDASSQSPDVTPENRSELGSKQLDGDAEESASSSPVAALPVGTLLDSGLPDEGKLLPPSGGLNPAIMPVEATVIGGKDAGVKAPQQIEMDIALAKQQSTLVNQMKGALSEQKIATVDAQKTQTKAFNAAPVLTQQAVESLSGKAPEKINIQDARYAKMLSDVPVGEVIQQASKLQQVPLATSVSAATVMPQISTAVDMNAPSLTNGLNQTLASSIPANIQSSNWSQQMSQQVSYMMKGGFQQAEIKLNPANLGPMEIKLSLKDDNVSISFVAQHAPVRDAIDAAMPRLKDMLEQQGMNLSDADVSSQSEQQQAQAESESGKGSNVLDDNKSEIAAEAHEETIHTVVTLDDRPGVSVFA